MDIKSSSSTVSKKSTAPITVHFVVHCRFIRSYEWVFLTGNLNRLGNWQPDQAIELVQDRRDRSIWRTKIELPIEETREMIKFRYFIGYYLQAGPDPSPKIRVIGRWESQRSPRVLMPSVEADSNSVCRLKHVDEFGIYGGREIVSDGWLNHTGQNEILLRLHDDALKFYKKRHQSLAYYIKIIPFDLRHKEDYAPYSSGEDVQKLWTRLSSFCVSVDEEDEHCTLPLLPSFSPTDLAVLTDDDPVFYDQKSHGKLFRNNFDYFIYRTQTIALQFLAFRVELYADKNNTAPNSSKRDTEIQTAERVALAYVMPSSISNSSGNLMVPIISKTSQLPIGQLTIDYLSIQTMSVSVDVQLTMETSFSRYWRKRPTVEIGHRGYGVSTTKLSNVRENTIHSLNYAAENGADYVEFDVQLTKDRVPIIFHDFHLLVKVAKRSTSNGLNANSNQLNPKKNNINASDFHEISVQDLKIEQLHLLHVEHYQAQMPDHSDKLPLITTDDESPDLRPFPTLVEALKKVSSNVGFNIEVKFPMMMQDDTHECDNYFERNEYIDLILKDIIENSKDRNIILSSFDPDICYMISRKQNRFPVLFLCIGNTKRYMSYKDKRSSISSIAVNFVVNSNLLGVNFHSEELLNDKCPIELAKKRNLVSFVWGDDLDIPENIEYFKTEINVDGIIFDKIGEIEKRQNCFVVERELRSVLFNSPSVSASTSRRSSVDDSPNNSAVSAFLTKEQLGSTEGLLLAGVRPKSPLIQNISRTPS